MTDYEDRKEALRRATTQVLNARNGLQLTTIERDELVRYAYKNGMTYQSIGEAVGLTRQRVAKICEPERDNGRWNRGVTDGPGESSKDGGK